MNSLITTFHIDWKIIIAQAINFGVVLAVLYFFALKPLSKLMAERQKRIEDGLDDAKQNANLLAKTKKEYDDVIAKARIEAHNVFQSGKKEAEENKKNILEKTQQEVESMIASGKKALDAEKVKIVEEAKNEIVSLVVAATEKLLESHGDDSYDKNTIKRIEKIK
ncbi:MAG: F0F1 ATP synthase subunit B [Patescibacteria group bacterium]|nr:F0F1 ATP synthase subunit B [Patescibacteria group bacterium]